MRVVIAVEVIATPDVEAAILEHLALSQGIEAPITVNLAQGVEFQANLLDVERVD